jgi:hypothetical protein
MLDNQVTRFWRWFAKNSHRLYSDSYETDLLHQLDRTISEWNLTWEIGPGMTKKNSLTISPHGNNDLLDKAKSIIGEAPIIDDWEFYYSKQPKENWYNARLVDRAFDIDASDWTYVLYQYEDNKIEIVLKADSLSRLDKETKELAADLVLTNLLGEKLKMEKIDFIDIVDEFDDEKGITELKFLPVHLTDKRYVK